MIMKRLFTSIITLLATLPMLSQGWPAQYEGVMLQGFYWDGYDDAQWTVLESQADELSSYFKLVWIPKVVTAVASQWATMICTGFLVTTTVHLELRKSCDQ